MPLTEDTLSCLGAEVPLPKIDRALKELWSSDEAKTRASLINFAIYSEDPDSIVKNSEQMSRITDDNACRALLITCLPEVKPQRARAWINALCRPYQGKQVVCSEQISFVLEGGDAAQVQNVVFAHLDSDLPLIVWWQGDLTKNFEERFYSRIDTLIIDSGRWTDPVSEFAGLVAAKEVADFDVRDLSWTRSHFLRTALANSFQDAKAREHLPLVENIEITHAPGQRCAALLLAGWICQRLGASLDEKKEGLVFSKADGSTLTISLTEKSQGCALQSLRLTAPCLEVSITREGASAFVHTHASCEGHSHEEILPADVVGDAELISEQLSRAGGSTHYSHVLPLIQPMLARLS
ncbi:glucose-6-phosphate dehydrogenase-related protein OpcA [Prosthecobacter fusiformis]|uniref:Glucose-6-phosphate dehydrogenase-related protein OpcA n=1 Tax=Prosthecobacter fusiformis TaxID=48464 RepID=A0A4R7SUB2_9BACT|nr:glucose-6-phosphate dehydrogenase assembly protein OpcA [Prosthecobacter fusiformis]TDU81878.1 glucose-6-phosphate dehydrogenase-related protein OpcA [Prosthecobacter fusiformis]